MREGSESLAVKLDQWGVPDAQEKIQLAVENNLPSLQQIRFERIWDLGTGVLGQSDGLHRSGGHFPDPDDFHVVRGADVRSAFRGDQPGARAEHRAHALNATRDIQRYLAIKTVISLITGFLAGLLCWAAGLDFFILWGIIAFALNFIPVIGSLIAGVPPTILALLVAGAPNAILVAGGYLLINNFLGNFVEPILVGRRFGISTLVVVISVMFWGWVWGPFGMLLAVPLTMLLKVVLDGSDEFRWIGVAISAEQNHGNTETKRLEIALNPQPGAVAESEGGELKT